MILKLVLSFICLWQFVVDLAVCEGSSGLPDCFLAVTFYLYAMLYLLLSNSNIIILIPGWPFFLLLNLRLLSGNTFFFCNCFSWIG